MSDSTRSVNLPEASQLGKPYREFLANVSQNDPDHYYGFGLTLGDVIAHQQKAFSVFWEAFDREVASGIRKTQKDTDPIHYASGWADTVIWENLRAVAVLRAHPEGRRELVAIKLDEPDEPAALPDPVAANGNRVIEQDANGVLIYRHDVGPGPFRSYRVVAENGVLMSIHEGRGLELDAVIERSVEGWRDTEFWEGDSVDYTVICGGKVVCLLRRDAASEDFYKVLHLDDAWASSPSPKPSRVHPRLADLCEQFSECSVRQREAERLYNENSDDHEFEVLEKEFDAAQDDFIAVHQALSDELEKSALPYVFHGGKLIVDITKAIAWPDLPTLNLFAFDALPGGSHADDAKGGGR